MLHIEHRLNRIPRRRTRAFTLIELLLVMVILAVLASVVVMNFTGRSEQARQAAAKQDIATLEAALDAFEMEFGRFPTTSEGLQALLEPPAGHRPYIKRAPLDPWRNAYVYRCPGTHNPDSYDLFSMGAEGREGPNNIANWDK